MLQQPAVCIWHKYVLATGTFLSLSVFIIQITSIRDGFANSVLISSSVIWNRSLQVTTSFVQFRDRWDSTDTLT